MTLSALLTEFKKRDTTIRVFVGCITAFHGKVSDMSVSQWVKLHPYFNCTIISRRMINNTLVVTI
jgi:hypothetical protein